MRSSLRLKLVVTTTAIIVVMLALLLANTTRHLNSIVERQGALRVASIDTALNQSLADNVFQRDFSAAKTIVDELMHRAPDTFVYVVVFDLQKRVFVSSGQVDVNKLPPKELRPNYEQHVFNASFPLKLGSLQVGEVRYGLSLTPLIEVRETILKEDLLIAGLTLIVMALTISAIGYWLTRDLDHMVRTTRAMAVGEYKGGVAVRSRDELGVLAQNFNEMAAAIREQMQELREQAALLNLAHDAIIVRDLRSRVTFWNRGAQASYGWSAQEAVGQITHELLHTEFPAPLRDIEGTLLGSGQWEGELRHRTRSGQYITVASRWALQRDAQGVPIRILEINRDVTERKRVDEELLQYRAHLEQLVQERTSQLQEAQRIAHIGNWNWSLASGELTWSDEVFRIFGYEPNAFAPTFDRFMSAVHVDDKQRLNLALDASLRHKKPHDIDMRIVLPDGQQRWSHVDGVAKFDADDVAFEMTGTIQDITVRKHVEAELIEAKELAELASNAKTEFLARMSHELRTPMNAILGFSQVLEMETLSEEQSSYVREIHNAGDHLLELINDLLDLSRIESGQFTTEIRTVSLDAIIEHARQLMTPLLKQRSVTIFNDCQSISVLADPRRLKQVLVNLLSNAIKYNRMGGEVRLSCKHIDDDHVRIMVKDTGPGIAPDKIDRLFRPFERLGAEFGAVDGTGIGLALSKRLTELMGGMLGVDSTQGKGSTFWIDLAHTPGHGQTEAITASTSPDVLSNSFKVLYVEDNAANLKVVEAMLRHQPEMTLLSSTNGEQALELAKRYLPDVILLDIHLPGMDGYAVLEALRLDVKTRNIPVIALSADAMPIDIERGIRAGFAHYLTKPVKREELIAALSSS